MRRLLQLLVARFTGPDGLPVRVTLRDGRQFLAILEGEEQGEFLVRPRWPDAAGRRPLLFLPHAQVTELAHRSDRPGMQALVLGVGALGSVFLSAALSAGRPVWPRGVEFWIGGALLGALVALPVLFVAQRSRWLSAWGPLALPPDDGPGTSRAEAG